MNGGPSDRVPKRRSGLFLRIYLTFVLTVLAFAGAAALAMHSVATSYDADWVAQIADTVTEHNDEIWAAREDTEAARGQIAELEQELGANVRVIPRGPDRDRFFRPPHGQRPHAHHRLDRHQRRMLKHARPVVQRQGPLRPPRVIWRIVDPQTQQMAAIVVVDTPAGSKRRVALVGLLLGLTVLGGGAWALARPLTRRLAALELHTERFAGGDLAHRAKVGASAPRDEIDQLALAFNEMAGKIESLLKGQQVLLANVSHELRTPIARMRVLVEILAERIAGAGSPEDPDRRRLETGLKEMTEDLVEVELLINDLLTSGRLELGRDAVLQMGSVSVAPMLDKLGDRFSASVSCTPPDLRIEADSLLLERLLINLLSNARRACPDEAVTLSCHAEGDTVVFEVEDRGPGIDPDKREAIFEPFARLDAARDRDQGGAGLGLHLCRQIAQAHRGTILAQPRRDDERGARMVVRLPVG